MKVEIAPRMRPDRRCFIGGSDAWATISTDESALVRLLKKKRSEESKILRTSSLLRMSATSWQRTTRVSKPRPRGSAVGWLFKLFICFLHSRSAHPDADPIAVFTDKEQAGRLHRQPQPLAHAQPRVSTFVSNRLAVSTPRLAASARSAVLQPRAARTAPHLIGITWQNSH